VNKQKPLKIHKELDRTQNHRCRLQAVQHYQAQEKPSRGGFRVLLSAIAFTALRRALKSSGSIQESFS